MTFLPKLYSAQLSEVRKKRLIPLVEGRIEREISLCYYRPYAKWNVIKRLNEDIQELVKEKLI
jgi:LysR family hydrogen peroxide-inducible transcriptional activator